MSNLKPITIDGYIALFSQAQQEHISLDEPIPEMNDESNGAIEYILSVPFQRAFGKLLYWGFYKKVAILFYLMIKNHPLGNGNKRMACYCLLFFYKINDRQFLLKEDELYNLAYFVVNSKSDDYENVIQHIANYLRNY